MTAAVAALLWWRRPSALQHVMAFIAAILLTGALAAFPNRASGENWIGLAVATFGIVWLLFAWAERLPPIAVGFVLGSAAVLIGLQIMVIAGLPGDSGDDGITNAVLSVVAVGAALALGAFGVVTRRMSLVASGVIGLVILLPQMAHRLLGDSLGVAFALLLSGIALIGGAIVIARLRSQW